MGWETGVTLGANALSGFNKTNTAVAQTGAIAQQADYEAQNYADATVRRVGSLEASFGHGGIALESAGPQAIFQQAIAQGSTNVQRTVANANAQSTNLINSARTSALEGIASGFSKMGVGTLENQASQLYSGSWLQDAYNSTWQDVGSMLDPSPTGPYLPFGVSR